VTGESPGITSGQNDQKWTAQKIADEPKMTPEEKREAIRKEEFKILLLSILEDKEFMAELRKDLSTDPEVRMAIRQSISEQMEAFNLHF
jgi:hypothetical protein